MAWADILVLPLFSCATLDMLLNCLNIRYAHIKQEKELLTYQVLLKKEIKCMKPQAQGLESSNGDGDDDDINNLYWMLLFAKHFSECFIWINTFIL